MSIASRSYVAPFTIAHELDVSDNVVRRWIREGELPTVRIEGFVRVPVEAYQAFLRRKIANTETSVA
ncbi:MAG: helix-turn-helix domain-containing protein [Fimbriimonadales bacterium]